MLTDGGKDREGDRKKLRQKVKKGHEMREIKFRKLEGVRPLIKYVSVSERVYNLIQVHCGREE